MTSWASGRRTSVPSGRRRRTRASGLWLVQMVPWRNVIISLLRLSSLAAGCGPTKRERDCTICGAPTSSTHASFVFLLGDVKFGPHNRGSLDTCHAASVLVPDAPQTYPTSSGSHLREGTEGAGVCVDFCTRDATGSRQLEPSNYNRFASLFAQQQVSFYFTNS